MLLLIYFSYLWIGLLQRRTRLYWWLCICFKKRLLCAYPKIRSLTFHRYIYFLLNPIYCNGIWRDGCLGRGRLWCGKSFSVTVWERLLSLRAVFLSRVVRQYTTTKKKMFSFAAHTMDRVQSALRAIIAYIVTFPTSLLRLTKLFVMSKLWAVKTSQRIWNI